MEKASANVNVNCNLLEIRKELVEFNNFDETKGSASFNNNKISLKTNGSSAFGFNIFQNNLKLVKGKSYRLSCNDINQDTWISINNENDKMLDVNTPLKDFEISDDIINPKIVIWINKNVTYNCVWTIMLTEL